MQKIYYPFESNNPVTFNFATKQQYKYVNSRPLSGSIIIIRFQQIERIHTLTFFFDNTSAQITAVSIIDETFKIHQFIEFIETLEKYNLIKPFTFKMDANLDVVEKYYTLLVPKNLKRERISNILLDRHIILYPYL